MHRIRARLFVVLYLFTALSARGEGESFARGVIVSCQTWGGEWGRPEMATTMDELKGLGAGWIAIHPYAQIKADGGLRWRSEPAPEHLTRPLAWAKERALGVMMIPHIAYWGSPFSWRGDIRFDDPAGWNRFFDDYEKWIVEMATVAEAGGAGRFCVGLEYSHAEKYSERWRRIIAAVRAVYRGRLSYGANWTDFEKVPFWDAVDEIGVLAYFPLTESENPSAEKIAAGWEPWLKKLAALSKKSGKQIVFTEVGYNDDAHCAARPWEFHRGPGSPSPELQARCLGVALNMQKRAPWLAGAFLWKWFPDVPSHEHRESFDLRTPLLKSIIAGAWHPSAGL